ncbi:MAG: V-type ATPase subunit [Clostridiales bacterium]|nr:V-type ATPase subunit [Clostridiales bacterium]
MSTSTKVYANMLASESGKRLDAERLRRVIDAKSLADAFKMLSDYGFNYVEGCTVDGFVVDQTNALIAFIADAAAGDKLKNALLARFTYNNAKLAYKSRFTETPADGYYTIPDFAADKIAKGEYDDLDKFMRECLEKLDEDGESKPQKIDIALTRAMYKYVLSNGIPLVKKYFKAEIDMKNILSAARMKRLGMDADEFVDGGSVSRERLTEAVGADDFAECFEHTPFEEYATRIAADEFKNLWKAERDADDYLYYLTAKQVENYTSYEPFINYYTDALIELKTVKMALVCVKTGVKDGFYNRLSDIYNS